MKSLFRIMRLPVTEGVSSLTMRVITPLRYGNRDRLLNRVMLMPRKLLGVLFLKGQGVPTHHEIAVVLFKLSAKQGNVLAQTYLGGMHGLGQGVKKIW